VLGAVLGVIVAIIAGPRLAPLLYEVPARDPVTFAVVIVTLLAVAVGASLVPAARAARVDPNVALRSE
jgi:ABC-type lipoprotein release transport system permease subunit